MILNLRIDELGDLVSVDFEEAELRQAYSRIAAAAYGNLHFVRGEIDGHHAGVMMRFEFSYGAGFAPAS